MTMTPSEKSELKKAFRSAQSADEMLKELKRMESCFNETDLGLEYWSVARTLVTESRPSEEVLLFGKKALENLLRSTTPTKTPCLLGTTTTLTHDSSFIIACVCNLLGSACFDSKRYEESLGYLNWANRNLNKLNEKNNIFCSDNCVLRTLLGNQNQQLNVRLAMGMKYEVVLHLMKISEIIEKMNDEGYVELAEAYTKVFEAYITARDFKEALPICLKALEVHSKHLGHKSVEIARITRHLAVIYYELGEYEKALAQNESSLHILMKEAPMSPDLLKTKIEKCNMLIHLNRCKNAIVILKKVIKHTEKGGIEHAIALVSMSRAHCFKKKFDDARECLKAAQIILDNKEICPLLAVTVFVDMSLLYEKMYDFGKAASLLSRVLLIPKLLQNLLLNYSDRLFSLISVAGYGMEEVGFSCLEDIVEKLKESFGPKHRQVGDGYKTLGTAYRKLKQQDSAAKFMKLAKDIMDVSLGPNHLESLRTSQDLSVTYATIGRFHEAAEIQAKVVEGLNGLVPRDEVLLDEAVDYLKKMRQGIAVSPSLPPSSLP